MLSLCRTVTWCWIVGSEGRSVGLSGTILSAIGGVLTKIFHHLSLYYRCYRRRQSESEQESEGE